MADNNRIKRRTALKSIGTAGAIGLGSGLSGAASGVKNGIDVNELSGRGAYRQYFKALRSSEFRKIKESIRRDGHVLNRQDIQAYSVDSKTGTSFEAVVVSYSTNDEQKNIEIGLKTQGKAPIPNKGTVFYQSDNGHPYKTEEYIPSRNMPNNDIKRDDGIELNSETIDVGQGTVLKTTAQIDEGRSLLQSGSKLTASAPDPCDLSPVSCTDCKNFVSAVNVVGCGTATWLICAAASIPTRGLAGLGCALTVGIVCWIIIDIGTNNPKVVCSQDYGCELPCA